MTNNKMTVNASVPTNLEIPCCNPTPRPKSSTPVEISRLVTMLRTILATKLPMKKIIAADNRLGKYVNSLLNMSCNGATRLSMPKVPRTSGRKSKKTNQ